MRLVAHVIAGNSIAVLDGCIEHHRALGVDAFFVLHVHSDDRTPERLRELASHHPDIQVFFSNMDDAISGAAHRKSLEMVRTSMNPDWIVQIDCDERWLVREGTLKDLLGGVSEDALSVPRYNAVWATPEQAQWADRVKLNSTDLQIAAFPAHVPPDEFDSRGIPWVLTRIEPKCCMRANGRNRFAMGGHQVDGGATSAAVAHGTSPGVLVSQLAFSTLERFATKVKVAAWCQQKYGAGFGPEIGWHWRRWARIYEQGPEAVRGEWEKQFLTRDAARLLVGREVIVSAQEALAT